MFSGIKSRLNIAAIISILLALLLVSPVLAQTYYVLISVANTGTRDYEMLAVNATLNIDYMADNGYIDADGLDTRILSGGAAIPHMLVEDKVMFARASSINSSNTVMFTMGNTALSAFDIIAGHGGYVTTTDAAALEPANDFSLLTDGYFNPTLSGSSISKEDAVVIYADGAGNVVGAILGNDIQTSPTGFSDPDTAWTDEAEAYDGDTGTDAECAGVGTDSWSEYIELTHASIMCKGVRYFADYDADTFDEIDVDAYYNSAWHDVYQGSYADEAWEERNFPDGAVYAVTKFRFRFYNEDVLVAGVATAELFEVDFLELNEDLSVSAVIATADDYEVELEADAGGNTLKLYVDTVEEDNAVLGANTVPGNANDWILLSEGTPYLNSYEHTVAGTLIVHYEPEDIIVDDTLPDLEGVAQDGAFTWGSNPSGIAITVGSLIAFTDEGAPTGETDTPDVAGDINEPAGMFPEDEDMTGTGLAWLWPTVNEVSDLTDTPIQLFWWLGCAIFVLASIAGAMKHTDNLFLAGMAGVLAVAICFGMSFLPAWLIIVAILAAVGLAAMERSPSL